MVLSAIWAEAFWLKICEETILEKVLQLARCVILEQIEGLPEHHLLPVPDIVGVLTTLLPYFCRS